MITKSAERLVSSQMEKTAIARWKELWSGLSPVNQGRLVNSGTVIPWQREAAGINRGTKNILKRYGATEISPTPGMGVRRDGVFQPAGDVISLGGHSSYASGPTGMLDTTMRPRGGTLFGKREDTARPFSAREALLEDAVLRRHEAYEVAEAHRLNRKYRKKYGDNVVVENTPVQLDDGFVRPWMGNHQSPSVLVNELKLINRSPNAYMNTVPLQNYRSMETGENVFLHKARTGDRRFLDAGKDGYNAAAYEKLRDADDITRKKILGFLESYPNRLTDDDMRAILQYAVDKRPAYGMLEGNLLYKRRLLDKDYRKMHRNWRNYSSELETRGGVPYLTNYVTV